MKAKIQNAFFGLFACFLCGAIFFACKKDSGQEVDKSFNAVQERSDEFTGTFTTFSLPSTTDFMDNRKAIACAFSKEMQVNPAFRNFMYAQLLPNGYRYKEIVIGIFKQKNFENTNVGSIINQRLREFSSYANELNPLETILQHDKLLTIWLPHEFIYSQPENVFSNIIPIIVDDTGVNNLFVAGKSTTYNNPDELFAFHISEAKNHKLLNVASEKYEDTNTAFFDLHGFSISKCPAVQNHLNSIGDYTYASGKKLIDPVDDVYLVMENECGGEPPIIDDPQVTNMPPPDYECQRASFQLKVRGNYDKHSNHFVSFSLASEAAFDLIESHPCNEWLNNGVRPFQFNWAYATGGVIQDQPKNKVIPVYKTQLVQEKYKWIAVTNWFGGTQWKKVPDGKSLLRYKFPSPFPVFSTSLVDNHWKPESNGDIVRVDVKLAHLGPCTSTNQIATADSYKIGGSVKFGFPKLGTNTTGEVVGTFEETSSQTKTVTFQIAGTAVYDLGRAEFTYCQPYSSVILPPPAGPSAPDARGGWLFSGSTGSVVIFMNAPWFN